MTTQTENKKFNIRKNLMKNSFGAMLMLSACSISTDAVATPLEYLALHDDLARATARMRPQEKIDFAVNHYFRHGYREGRTFDWNLPQDFSGLSYVALHPDLEQAARPLGVVDTELWGIKHYVNHGRAEGRNYRWDLPQGFSGRGYVDLYPDLVRGTAGMGALEKEIWGRRHFNNHGRNEGRDYAVNYRINYVAFFKLF